MVSDPAPSPASPLPLGAPPPTKVNPLSLSVTEAARMLSAAGGRIITPAQIQADLAAGAPVGPEGRINLIHYAAWLVREVQAGRRGG